MTANRIGARTPHSVALLLGVAVVPGEHAVLDREECPVEDIAQSRQGQHAREHLANPERAARLQDSRDVRGRADPGGSGLYPQPGIPRDREPRARLALRLHPAAAQLNAVSWRRFDWLSSRGAARSQVYAACVNLAACGAPGSIVPDRWLWIPGPRAKARVPE